MWDTKAFEGNVALKIDIKKDFDIWTRVSSSKCLKVLDSLKPLSLEYILSFYLPRFLFLSMAKWWVISLAKRDSNKGDPLSPILFCLTKEALSCGLSTLVGRGQLQPMTGPKFYQTRNHVMYTNDIIIFFKGTSKNMKEIMLLFEEHGTTSGQIINKEKP